MPDADEPTQPPIKPTGMERGQSKVWDQLFPLISRVAREGDAPLLADLCFWWNELRKIKAEISKMKPSDKRYNQRITGAAIIQDKVDKIACRFGLTPADRTRLRVEMAGPQKPRVATRPRTKLDKNGKPK